MLSLAITSIWLVDCSHSDDLESIAASFPTSDSVIEQARTDPALSDEEATRREGAEPSGSEPETLADARGIQQNATERDSLTLEPNDTPGQAAPMLVDQTFEHVSLKPSDDEIDYYRATVEQDITYTLDIQNPSRCYMGYRVGLGADGSRVALVQPGGTVTAQTVLGHVVKEFRSPEAGPVLIEVELETFSGSCDPYEIVVRRSTAAGLEHDADTLEPNDSPSTAATVSVNQTVEHLNLREGRDTFDFYRVSDLAEGREYSLEIANPDGCFLDYEMNADDAIGTELVPPRWSIDANANRLRLVTVTFTASSTAAVLRIGADVCANYGFAVRSLG